MKKILILFISFITFVSFNDVFAASNNIQVDLDREVIGVGGNIPFTCNDDLCNFCEILHISNTNVVIPYYNEYIRCSSIARGSYDLSVSFPLKLVNVGTSEVSIGIQPSSGAGSVGPNIIKYVTVLEPITTTTTTTTKKTTTTTKLTTTTKKTTTKVNTTTKKVTTTTSKGNNQTTTRTTKKVNTTGITTTKINTTTTNNYKTETTTTNVIEPPIEEITEEQPEETKQENTYPLLLKNLIIEGYEIDFDPNKFKYEIKTNDTIFKIKTETYENQTSFNGELDVQDRDYFTITVKDKITKEEKDYEITLIREKENEEKSEENKKDNNIVKIVLITSSSIIIISGGTYFIIKMKKIK